MLGYERRSPWSVFATALRFMGSTIFRISPRNSFGAMPNIAPSTPQVREIPTPRSCLGHGVCTFLFDPASGPKYEPACWRADACPFVLRIDGACPRVPFPALVLENDVADGGRRYVVLRNAVGAHRIELGNDPTAGEPKFELPLDAALRVRLACLQAYALGTATSAQGLRPTAYQAGRLALMLAILDKLDHADGPLADTRVIAAELVFPGAELPRRAIEWKSSGLRRQTQRIIAAAKWMRDCGFRQLLQGRISIPASSSARVPHTI